MKEVSAVRLLAVVPGLTGRAPRTVEQWAADYPAH
jgi:hypothetical protein